MSHPGDQSVQPVAHIAAHWKLVAVTCAAALLVSSIATLLLPKKYTGVTRIYIEAPAGSDPRMSTAVSPIYLDSLRTYELFASSDSLFQQAVDHFHLRQQGVPVDRLKKSVLKVEVVRNTRILDVSTTLTDPKMAHELSLYIAQQTVKMNEETRLNGDREFTSEAEKQLIAARARMDSAQQAWDTTPDQLTSDNLRSEVSADEQLRDTLKKELAELEVGDPDATGAGASLIAGYRRRLATLDQQIAEKRQKFATVTARLERLQSDLGAARRAFASAEGRFLELRSSIGSRGEQLRIIDPGIIPERPSSPDLLLNLLIALLAGAIISIGGLLLTATGSQSETPHRRPVSIVAK